MKSKEYYKKFLKEMGVVKWKMNYHIRWSKFYLRLYAMIGGFVLKRKAYHDQCINDHWAKNKDKITIALRELDEYVAEMMNHPKE